MFDFDKYIARHGECGAQALVEQIERMAGIRGNSEAPLPLEVRWNNVMQRPLPLERMAA